MCSCLRALKTSLAAEFRACGVSAETTPFFSFLFLSFLFSSFVFNAGAYKHYNHLLCD